MHHYSVASLFHTAEIAVITIMISDNWSLITLLWCAVSFDSVLSCAEYLDDVRPLCCRACVSFGQL